MYEFQQVPPLLQASVSISASRVSVPETTLRLYHSLGFIRLGKAILLTIMTFITAKGYRLKSVTGKGA